MRVSKPGKVFVFMEMAVKGKDYLVGKCHGRTEEEVKDSSYGFHLERP